MSDLLMWSALVGFFLPLVIAFVNQPRFPEWLGVTITVIVSAAAGYVTVLLQDGPLNWHNLATSVLTIVTAAVFFYQHTWKGTATTIKTKTAPAKLK